MLTITIYQNSLHMVFPKEVNMLVFGKNVDSLQKALYAIVAFEGIELNGKEINNNGKINSGLEVDIINGQNITNNKDRAIALGKLIASTIKKALNGLLPLMGVCATAYFVSFFILKGGSIMTEKIQRRGVKTPDSYKPDVLQIINAGQLATDLKPEHKHLPSIYMNDDAGLAAELMGKHNEETLLVLENKTSLKIMGVVTAASILKYYSEQKQKDNSYDSPTQTKRLMVKGRKFMKKVRR